jgi:VanZ family protein
MFSKLEQYRIVPMIIVMGIIFFLSHQHGDTIDLPGIPGIDKVGHFLIYGTLAATVIIAHRQSTRNGSSLKVSLNTIVVCLLYGLSDECHQSFVPGRYVSVGDIVADVTGAALACALWLLVRRRIA